MSVSISIALSTAIVYVSLQVVGPPGTGKTDVAVQIISNIYHNFPEQRTLIVTHSNQVLIRHCLEIACSQNEFDFKSRLLYDPPCSRRDSDEEEEEESIIMNSCS